MVEIVAAVGSKARRGHAPQGGRALGISTTSTNSLPSWKAKYAVRNLFSIHAILETAEGVDNVADIATASPRMHGISLGPADLAASRAMKTTRVGGGHPDYVVLADASGAEARPKSSNRISGTTRIAKMVDACAAAGIKPFYGPFGDFSDPDSLRGAIPQCLPHGLRRRLDAASEPGTHRQARVFARSGRGGVRQENHRRHARRHRCGHDRRQDAGRCDLEAGQGGCSISPVWLRPRTRRWRRATAYDPLACAAILDYVGLT